MQDLINRLLGPGDPKAWANAHFRSEAPGFLRGHVIFRREALGKLEIQVWIWVKYKYRLPPPAGGRLVLRGMMRAVVVTREEQRCRDAG